MNGESGRYGGVEPGSKPVVYRGTPWRWFILFYFSLSNCNQCLSWFSFSSTDEATMQSFFGDKMDHDTLDLLLNWGPIIGVLTFYPQTWLLEQPEGFKKGCWIGIVLVLLGNILRCVPIIYANAAGHTAFVQSDLAFVCYHGGQIFIAAAGPFFMGTVTALSKIWFLENERTTATAIATTANALGTTIGFLNPQWLTLEPGQVPNIFWLSLGLSVVPLVCAMVYLPAHPKFPPSRAAEVSRSEELLAKRDDPTSTSGKTWLEKLLAAGKNRSFVVLIVSASILSGLQSGWGSLFQSILVPVGIDRNVVSTIGFGNGFAQNIGAFLSGWVIDNFFSRRLKIGIIAGLFGCLLSTAWFTVMIWGSASARPSEAALVLAICLSGFFSGVSTPLFYELSAEIIYPLKEGMSAGILVLLLNATSCITIFLNNVESGTSMNLIMTVTIGLVLVCVLCFIEEKYNRPQNE